MPTVDHYDERTSLRYLRQSELHLELVQVLMRHGQRTPLLKEFYPKDIYNESSYEPWGISQLTNDGKMTEYRIGTMLRRRYDAFLGPLYHPRDVYAISTDLDRTKMSLQLALAGLYPPQGNQQWNPDLNWFGIPTNYMPGKVDLMRSSCPSYAAALEEVKNTNEIRDKVAFYHDFFKFLSRKTGLTITEPMQVYELYNGLTAQKSMNLTLPEWCTDEVYRMMQELVLLEYDIRSYTTQLKRLNGGFLVKKFIDNMNPKIKHDVKRKIYIYSGHEVNIAAFAKAHNITDNETLPDFGSTFVVEKLRDEHFNFYVRIFYWTGITQKLLLMKLKHCDDVCPMDIYLELMRDVIPSDEEATCLWNNITKEELVQLYSDKLELN
ncbi:Testicular acid phosphatase-like protein [Harpegnathos saltator]|uniref:acid phosphatase n=1 Tax=Harpegnathos saltator TaxID=610380 RepID=E2C1V9_HARSA|nr:Testicular acid phosphatase-like protein [Harpegnathos saltator]